MRAGHPLRFTSWKIPQHSVFVLLSLRLLHFQLLFPLLHFLPAPRLSHAPQPRQLLTLRPVRTLLPRPPHIPEPLHLRHSTWQRQPPQRREEPSDQQPEAHLYVFPYESPRFVPLQPPQELRLPRDRFGALLAEPPQRSEIGDDELARENRRRRRRSGAARFVRSDSPLFPQPKEKSRFPAQAQPALHHVQVTRIFRRGEAALGGDERSGSGETIQSAACAFSVSFDVFRYPICRDGRP
ncbi:unnamed protein product [Prunus brigantina]